MQLGRKSTNLHQHQRTPRSIVATVDRSRRAEEVVGLAAALSRSKPSAMLNMGLYVVLPSPSVLGPAAAVNA